MNWSYWERSSFSGKYDVVIIGAGITGLSASISLKKQNPKLSVVVLERGVLPSGASTKNAGFACFGSLSELLADEKHVGQDIVLSLVEKRWQGLDLLRKSIGDKNLNFQQLGGFEVFTPAEEELFRYCDDNIERYNQLLKPIVGEQVFARSTHQAVQFGLSNIAHVIRNNYEGQLDTGRMMKALLNKAIEMSVDVRFGMEVSQLADHEVVCTNGLIFKSGHTVVTTNGFASQLVDVKVRPARAQVLITKPIEDFKLKGSFHLDEGYYYFRNVGERLLIGGGRNVDPTGEETVEMGNSDIIVEAITNVIDHHILKGIDYEIDGRWSGIMGVGDDKEPIVKRVSDHVVIGVKLGGMGVAIGSLVGKQVADLVLQSE